MPRQPRPLPPVLGDAFTVAEALAAGVTPGRLRAADLEVPFRGVRLAPVSEKTNQAAADERLPTPDELARAATTRLAVAYAKLMPQEEFYAGRTAAVLQGLPVDPGPALVVGVRSPRRPPRRAGVRGVKIAPALVHTHTRDGLRMTTPATTWAMLGSELEVRELVVVGDAIVRVPRDHTGARQPDEQLATIDQLERALAAGRRVGSAKLREALPLIREGSASPLETDFRLDAWADGLPEFELDVAIADRRGSRIGITEFVHRETRTLIEIEGDHHRIDRRQWNRDIEKYAAYVAEGWEVVRLTSTHVRGRDRRAVKIVRDVLVRRGWRP